MVVGLSKDIVQLVNSIKNSTLKTRIYIYNNWSYHSDTFNSWKNPLDCVLQFSLEIFTK